MPKIKEILQVWQKLEPLQEATPYREAFASHTGPVFSVLEPALLDCAQSTTFRQCLILQPNHSEISNIYDHSETRIGAIIYEVCARIGISPL